MCLDGNNEFAKLCCRKSGDAAKRDEDDEVIVEDKVKTNILYITEDTAPQAVGNSVKRYTLSVS